MLRNEVHEGTDTGEKLSIPSGMLRISGALNDVAKSILSIPSGMLRGCGGCLQGRGRRLSIPSGMLPGEGLVSDISGLFNLSIPSGMLHGVFRK